MNEIWEVIPDSRYSMLYFDLECRYGRTYMGYIGKDDQYNFINIFPNESTITFVRELFQKHHAICSFGGKHNDLGDLKRLLGLTIRNLHFDLAFYFPNKALINVESDLGYKRKDYKSVTCPEKLTIDELEIHNYEDVIILDYLLCDYYNQKLLHSDEEISGITIKPNRPDFKEYFEEKGVLIETN